MPYESLVIVESHPSAATLYAAGILTTKALCEIVARAHELPPTVRAVCIDLRDVRWADAHALRVLELGLRPWRVLRRGMTRVTLPKDANASVIALQLLPSQETPRVPRDAQALREPFGRRIPDQGRPS